MLFKNKKLRSAIIGGRTQDVKTLLDAGADPNGTDMDGDSMLWYAVRNGHREAVRMLLEKGARAEASLRYGSTLLHMAAEKGSVEITAMLLEKRPQLLDITDDVGNTPLHIAALNGYPELAADLIARGVDPRAKNYSNRTAYSLAQKKNHGDVMALLRPLTLPAGVLPADPALESIAPAAAVGITETTDSTWKKLQGERIARVAVEDAIGYRITEIFNFTAREKTTLYHNLAAKSDTVETRSFDDLGDKAALQEAMRQLQAQGGKPDPDSILGPAKKRLSVAP